MDKKEEKKGLGEEIKKMRVRAGMTQADLAKKTGIDRKNFWKWEKGIKEPSGLFLYKILNAVGVIK